MRLNVTLIFSLVKDMAFSLIKLAAWLNIPTRMRDQKPSLATGTAPCFVLVSQC